MNDKETIRILEKMSNDSTRFSKEERSAFLQAISEIKKQIPAMPDYEGEGYDENGELIYDTGYCPYCRNEFELGYDESKHCPECGQALDWSDTE